MLVIYNAFQVGLTNYGIKLTGDRELTKDCITQVLLNLWDKRKKLPEVENVRTFLVTCLHNELISEKRGQIAKMSKNRLLGKQEGGTIEPYEEELIRIQQNHALQQQIKRAFDELTPRQKELLRLRFFEDLTYTEIADQCRITKRTAYNIVQTGLQILKKHLLENNPNNPLTTADIFRLILPFFLVAREIIH